MATIKEMLKCTKALPAHITTGLDRKIIETFNTKQKKSFETKMEGKKLTRL